jgi:hypothetical protein
LEFTIEDITMKHTVLTFLIMGMFASSQAQNADLSTIDGLMESLYASISGPAGERDWEFFHSLYTSNAIMGAMRMTSEGNMIYSGFTPEEYVERNHPFLVENGFWEEELKRETVEYGELAHVFSSYEFRTEANGEEIRQRGINSLQLVFEDDRWWIISIQWNAERDSLPLPKKFAGKS